MKRRSFLLGSLAAAATPAVALPSAVPVLKEDMASRRAIYESALQNGMFWGFPKKKLAIYFRLSDEAKVTLGRLKPLP